MIIRAQTCKHACIFVQAPSWNRKLEVHTLYDSTVKNNNHSQTHKENEREKKSNQMPSRAFVFKLG